MLRQMNIKFRSRTTILIHDLIMIPVAWFGAYWLRFNLETIPDSFWYPAFLFLPYVMAVQVAMFWVYGLYRGVWRFSSLPDLIRITKSVLLGIFLVSTSLFLFDRLDSVPRAVVPLYVCLLLLLLCVPRFVYRFWKEKIFIEREGERALIVGAGSAGELLARDLLSDIDSGYIPVAFVDDTKSKINREIRGIRVVGGIDELQHQVISWEIDVILIAIPSATDLEMRRIVEICEACQVPFQTLPSVRSLLAGKVTRESLRDVAIEDILGRKPVHLDWKGIKRSLKNKVVLVTGGGGSIGSELCKQLAEIGPRLLIVLDQSEFNLYNVDRALSDQFPELDYRPVLGDITNRLSVRKVMEDYGPEVIFHAAAYKHVPLLESQVREAVHNNLIGSKVMAEEALAANVECFVRISTDKAVNPTNIMGGAKRAAEILCQNFDQSAETRFITVRFGNVLDSAGSVAPLFREQIRRGGPVTVTHPEIERYFMTILEACRLIIQAESVGEGGEIFVLNMGEPIKIAYLAEQMIRLSGKRPNQDIAIEFIGLRKGEKLYEELFYQQESLVETGYDKLQLAKAQFVDRSDWFEKLDSIESACDEYDNARIKYLLTQLVPEFLNEYEEDSKKTSTAL